MASNHRNLFAQETPKASPQPQLWIGELEVPGRQFRFVIETQVAAIDGSSSPHLRSVDEGNRQFDLQNFVSDGQELSFEIQATGATYQGIFDSDSQQWDGVWSQRGALSPLRFNAVSTVSFREPDEIWIGDLSAGFQKLKLQLRGHLQPDGRIQYYLDSLSQRAGGFKADQPIDTGSEVKLTFSALGATFEGQRLESPSSIQGRWTQGQTFDLELTRADTALEPSILNRPQQPKPPFPYEIREVTFPADGGNIQLHGTLTLPREVENCPVAILISGSGPQDRDSSIFGHKPFWVIADHLTRQGIAVLRYDERGVGASEGDFATATTLDFADDVEAIVEWVRQIPELDSSNIGLVGHSEGGIIAPMVAARNPSVSWIVLLAGTAVTGEETLISQGQLLIAAEGGSEQDQRWQREFQQLLFDSFKEIAPEDQSDTIPESRVNEIANRWRELDAEFTQAMSEDQLSETVKMSLEKLRKPWFRFFLTYDPSRALQQVTCPVLYLVGEKDLQVDPQLNLPRVRESLQQANNADFTLLELPGLNHLFQTCSTGAVSEYETIEETFSPKALEIITSWILER